MAARAVGFGLPLAVMMAWVLARYRFPGRPVLNALVHLPLVLPPVVTGWLLLIIFGIRGPIGSLLLDWFDVRLVFTTAGASLACAVMTFPVMVRAIRLSLEMADPGLEQAARTLGAVVEIASGLAATDRVIQNPPDGVASGGANILRAGL